MNSYHRTTIREVADDVSISSGTCQAIFMDALDIKSATAKIVPKLLNFEHKQCCMGSAQGMLTTFNDDPDLLKKRLTVNESWVYGYDIEKKPNHSNGSVQKSQDRKCTPNSVRCEGMCIAFCFLRLQWRGASSVLATR